MKNQRPIIPITVLIIIIAIAILMVGVAWWYMNNKTTNIACNTDTNCILSYTGDQPCAPCDYAHVDYKCVSSEQAKRLEQERIAGGVMCKLCDLSPLLYRCTCQGKAGKACIKTANCDKDEDCITKSFSGGQYKCINNKCSSLAATNTNINTNTNTALVIDLTSFKAMAQQANCADRRNDLYVIDNQMVFWAKEGACFDASYSYVLYGKTPQERFCQSADSVAGQMKGCDNQNYQEIFDTILNNLKKSDLDLGASHTVQQISLSGNINANANVNTNTSPSDCSLIKTKDECDSRSDCLSVDLCHCTTERYRATKCGYFIENLCVCDMGGFSRCEKLTCPSSTNTNTVTTNTNTVPTDQATCESQGGKWGLVGLNPKPQCNLPTKDGGKECSNADECEAMLCIAELTKEEINSMSGLYTLEKNGKCPEWRFNVGCPWIVNNGKVGRICID